MKWTDDYQVFMFDFDGLLVNTEEVHYHAYQLACEKQGWQMPWSFPEYCNMAHYHAEGLKDAMYKIFPGLRKMGWDAFYQLKTDIIEGLVTNGEVQLMPGVKKLLGQLEQSGKKRCVVTHSKDVLVDPVRSQHPILNTIPIWITREYYTHPKPNPECYQKAIERLAVNGDRIVGFEDTPRGMRALMGTRAKAVIISQIQYPEIEGFIRDGAIHYSSFEEIPSSHL